MLNLTLACGHYDRTEALRDGRVQPDGIRLNCLTLKVEETFWRMMQYREFDVAETSLGGYVVRRGARRRRPGGDSGFPVTVLPPVLHLRSRRLRHRHAAGPQGQAHRGFRNTR